MNAQQWREVGFGRNLLDTVLDELFWLVRRGLDLDLDKNMTVQQ